MTWGLVAVVAVAAVVYAVARRRRHAARRAQVRELASELVPEIRELLDSVDPAGASSGEPAPSLHYQACRARLPGVLSTEDFFAVETFYQCLESYRGARREMMAAFAEDDERSLGDRIRAKDRRDRCLKDLYYTGHAAVEKLERLMTLKRGQP